MHNIDSYRLWFSIRMKSLNKNTLISPDKFVDDIADIGGMYLIQMEESNYLKLGWSKRPFTRLKNLQTGNPFKLDIVRLVPANRWYEDDTHKILREKPQNTNFEFRVRGEWYFDKHDLITSLVDDMVLRYLATGYVMI